MLVSPFPLARGEPVEGVVQMLQVTPCRWWTEPFQLWDLTPTKVLLGSREWQLTHVLCVAPSEALCAEGAKISNPLSTRAQART